MELVEMIVEAIEGVAADVAFGFVVLASFALILLALMFFLLAVRGCVRWLVGHTWNDVIRSAERKALR